MISAKNINLRIGEFSLRDASLELGAGEYFVLLGPNGSGKTLLVSCLCGLVRPDGGRVIIDGRDVTRLAPRQRQIGYVPQDYGLFPHIRVAENVVFSLRAAGMSRAKAMERTAPLVKMLGLENLMRRWPATLSGGERQKTALARALAMEPRLLILDEPVSALDRPTCIEVLALLRRVQKSLGLTTIHICHNLDEAAAVADRAGIMLGGRIVQTGTLREIQSRPADDRVAGLLRPIPPLDANRNATVGQHYDSPA